ncbi:hypothetical protein BC831DRAFT_223292 [Entophlyctis helioformis]|nr:hypothetical protein BC831DRAFT_223292 [Entophlyctis helioformis]
MAGGRAGCICAPTLTAPGAGDCNGDGEGEGTPTMPPTACCCWACCWGCEVRMDCMDMRCACWAAACWAASWCDDDGSAALDAEKPGIGKPNELRDGRDSDRRSRGMLAAAALAGAPPCAPPLAAASGLDAALLSACCWCACCACCCCSWPLSTSMPESVERLARWFCRASGDMSGDGDDICCLLIFLFIICVRGRCGRRRRRHRRRRRARRQRPSASRCTHTHTSTRPAACSALLARVLAGRPSACSARSQPAATSSGQQAAGRWIWQAWCTRRYMPASLPRVACEPCTTGPAPSNPHAPLCVCGSRSCSP